MYKPVGAQCSYSSHPPMVIWWTATPSKCEDVLGGITYSITHYPWDKASVDVIRFPATLSSGHVDLHWGRCTIAQHHGVHFWNYVQFLQLWKANCRVWYYGRFPKFLYPLMLTVLCHRRDWCLGVITYNHQHCCFLDNHVNIWHWLTKRLQCVPFLNHYNAFVFPTP